LPSNSASLCRRVAIGKIPFRENATAATRVLRGSTPTRRITIKVRRLRVSILRHSQIHISYLNRLLAMIVRRRWFSLTRL
ncbi:hypothetical protein ABTF50_21390, partial [Acinetobacter baumannii]